MDETEKLRAIIELKKRGDRDEAVRNELSVVRNGVTAAPKALPPGSIR